MKDTDIIMIFNVKEKKNLIWISFLLEMDVYFQNIAQTASAEAIYRPQRGSRANKRMQISIQAWSYTQAEGELTGCWAACHPGALL